METIKVNTSQHVDIDYPVAGLGERIAARLIDLAFFLVLYFLFLLLWLIMAGTSSNVLIIVLIVIYAGSYIFYNLICEIFMNGQSIGKRLMKIKVISIDGSQASLGQYFIRWVFRLVDFVFTGQMAGLVSIAVSENKQRIGDMVAGTTLIKTEARTNIDHIAFHPVPEAYEPVFRNADQLTDRDIELVHEVIRTYHKNFKTDVVYATSAKVAEHLSVTIPEGMNELSFLNTVVKDYSYLTSLSE